MLYLQTPHLPAEVDAEEDIQDEEYDGKDGEPGCEAVELGYRFGDFDRDFDGVRDAVVPVVMVDYEGRDTYSSLMNYGRSLGFRNPSLTVISQPFHNQRAVFYGTRLFNSPIVAYNAQDTNIWYWKIWSFAREVLARTKAVVLVHSGH